MNRFEAQFLDRLVQLSRECGYIITENGIIEPIQDWVEEGKEFRYTTKENDEELSITGVEMI
ncbi:MAG: hypothetical protein ACOC3V_04065 [bacterium]